MPENILRQMHLITSNADLKMDEVIHNEALIIIENMYLILTNKAINTIRSDNAQSANAQRI